MAAAPGRSVADSLLAEALVNGGIRREPALPEHEAIVPEEPTWNTEFALLEDEPEDDVAPTEAMSFRAVARQLPSTLMTASDCEAGP